MCLEMLGFTPHDYIGKTINKRIDLLKSILIFCVNTDSWGKNKKKLQIINEHRLSGITEG